MYGTLSINLQLCFQDLSMLINADLADAYIPLKNTSQFIYFSIGRH